MTNAEKLANDTEFMVEAIINHCKQYENCFWCEFAYRNKSGCLTCKVGETDTEIKEWLESEATEK